MVWFVLLKRFESLLKTTLATRQFRFFPVRWLLKDKYESSKYAQGVSAPTLIVAAARDRVIPSDRTQALYEKFRPGVASLRVIEGVGHNDISDSPEYGLLLSRGR